MSGGGVGDGVESATNALAGVTACVPVAGSTCGARRVSSDIDQSTGPGSGCCGVGGEIEMVG